MLPLSTSYSSAETDPGACHFMHAFIDSCSTNASVRYSGIYHKLKINCPHKMMTFAHYLEMLQNKEIEGNSTSIFSRLCNSKHFWIKPWNDLNCMTLIYGPAIWFLTLSPSE